MIRTKCSSFLLLIVIVSLGACAETPTMPTESTTPREAGVNLLLIDKPCDAVVASIPIKLEELEYPFTWIDESQGLLSVGPITTDTKSGSQFLKIRQTYSFSAVCIDEVTTRMSCGIELQWLNADGEWIAIEDVPTLNEYVVQFLDNLNL